MALSKIQRAERLIEREAQICYDVAAQYGQIFDNVKHMSWFIQAVAEEFS